MRHELEEIKQELKGVNGVKIEINRELEITRRERNFLNESLKELQLLLS